MHVARTYNFSLGRLLGASRPASIDLAGDEAAHVPSVVVVNGGDYLSDTEENGAWHHQVRAATAGEFPFLTLSHDRDWRVLRAAATTACTWKVSEPIFVMPTSVPAYFTRAAVGLSDVSSGAAPEQGVFNVFAREVLPDGLIIPAGHVLRSQGVLLGGACTWSIWVQEA